MHDLHEPFETRDDRLRLQTVNTVDLVRPGDLARLYIPLPAAQVREVLRLGEAGLALLEGFLGLPALGDVPGHGAQRRPATVGDHGSARIHDYHRSVLPTVLPLAYVALPQFEATLNVPVDVLVVVGDDVVDAHAEKVCFSVAHELPEEIGRASCRERV